MEELLEVVMSQLVNFSEHTLTGCLTDYLQTDLYNEAWIELEKFLNDASTKLKDNVKLLYEIETEENPFTVNEDAFNRYKRLALDKIREVRKKIRAKTYQDRLERSRNKYTYGSQRVDIEAKITNEQLGPDPFEKELECMAYVQANYMVASMRWVDNVCQAVQSEFFKFIQLGIPGHLERSLGLIGTGGKSFP